MIEKYTIKENIRKTATQRNNVHSAFCFSFVFFVFFILSIFLFLLGNFAFNSGHVDVLYDLAYNIDEYAQSELVLSWFFIVIAVVILYFIVALRRKNVVDASDDVATVKLLGVILLVAGPVLSSVYLLAKIYANDPALESLPDGLYFLIIDFLFTSIPSFLLFVSLYKYKNFLRTLFIFSFPLFLLFSFGLKLAFAYSNMNIGF